MDASTNESEQPKWVRITSKDGWSFIVERKVALGSQTLADALKDDGGFAESQTNSCPVNERAAVTEKVVEYLVYKSQWSGQKGPLPDFINRIQPPMALELMMAADYLQL
ncbi:hypothetical protein FRC02_008827 [Tulasnella sp. 418]|nr:hypothetical protein FRC02_008827 [Tulasnella sp. 418]